MPALEVALHVVAGRVRLQESNAVDQSGDVTCATLQLGIGDVLEHVGAHHEVVAASEVHRVQLLEAAQLDVAPPSVPCHYVLARIDAEVAESGPQPAQL